MSTALGLLVGLVAGVGMLLVLLAITAGHERRPGPGRRRALVEDRLAAAGLSSIGVGRLALVCTASGAVGLLLVAAMSQSLVLAVAFGLGAAALPWLLVSRRARQRAGELRDVWPDVVDDLASAVRAGLSLAEALAQVGEHGPPPLRPAFRSFAADYRASGRFDDCADVLARRLADPVGDRLVAALRLARDVGGTDLGRLLRSLSAHLREDARTRGELEARASWTVNGARLAVAAPWITLAFLALRPEAVAAYDTPTGVVVLAVGAAVSAVAYRLMVHLGRLPDEPRVLR